MLPDDKAIGVCLLVVILVALWLTRKNSFCWHHWRKNKLKGRYQTWTCRKCGRDKMRKAPWKQFEAIHNTLSGQRPVLATKPTPAPVPVVATAHKEPIAVTAQPTPAPAGVTPRPLWVHMRCQEIARAVYEHIAAGNDIQQVKQWVDELKQTIEEYEQCSKT